MTLDELTAGHEVSKPRLVSLKRAIELGADDKTLEALREAARVGRASTIILPAHRLEGLSRGKGWARKGRGSSAIWGEKDDGGYRVGPGRWTVGGNDGFSRKGETEWVVKNISVGSEVWTIAD